MATARRDRLARANTRVVMTADAPLDFLVVYTPRARPFLCAEPVSHMTDAFNLAAAGGRTRGCAPWSRAKTTSGRDAQGGAVSQVEG